MKIENLKLKNYRNYENISIDFSSTLNLIYGNNGSGKSNLVEAIYLLALTKSFRTNTDHTLIRKGSESTNIKGTIISREEKSCYQVEISNNGKKAFIDNDKVDRISDYVSKINIVEFNPLDSKIISDSPAVRRKLINIEISQLDKEYLLLLNAYEKVLKHRNAYLKQLYLNGNASTEYLDILTKKLAEFGLKIHKTRTCFIEEINDNISKIYKNIFESGQLIVRYTSSYKDKTLEEIMEMYRKNYRKEMNLGKTLIGIHHDDIDFILDDNNIKEYGSVGQQKNAIISFKLSELLIFKRIKGEYPILILDDLFSELDNIKINNIISMLNKEIQTFITTTQINNIDQNLLENSTIFKVTNGSIERK